MKIIQHIDLTHFEFWSGAKDLADKLTYSELSQITDSLEDLYPNGMTETQINDLFWFEEDFICEMIGEKVDDVLDRD
tara:strand:- start:414 stop:644 length:231 start_codon:yes stop_codon:yes gene_type:complete